MRAMKDSGIPWIGMIPKEWNILPTSSLFYEHKQRNRDLEENNLLSLSYGKIKRKDINTQEGLLPQTFDNYNIINNGDIVFRLTDLQNDKKSLRTGLCNERGIITSAYLTIRAKEEASSSYFHYLFHTYDVCKVFYGLGDGVRQGMGYNDLRSLLIFCPPLSEQERIADFLDAKCGEIDEMIALQEKTVEELKAYKQSVITEAVTKGLNPDAPMKDSGIPWIGLIPQGWKVLPTSSLFNEHKQRNRDLEENNLLSLSYGKIKRKDINTKEGLLPQTFDNYNIINKGDIVFRLTDLQNDKKSLRTGLCNERGIITSAYLTIRAKEEVSSSYFYYLFHTYDICKVFYGLGDGVRQSMGYNDLRSLLIFCPSFSEQQAIAAYLDKKCSEIDSLIEIKQQKAEELKTYKKSLIYEYVTGKKEVV